MAGLMGSLMIYKAAWVIQIFDTGGRTNRGSTRGPQGPGILFFEFEKCRFCCIPRSPKQKISQKRLNMYQLITLQQQKYKQCAKSIVKQNRSIYRNFQLQTVVASADFLIGNFGCGIPVLTSCLQDQQMAQDHLDIRLTRYPRLLKSFISLYSITIVCCFISQFSN